MSRVAARREPHDAPAAEHFPASVLFADISGFTPLAERLAQRGAAGIEELSGLLNAFFGQLTTLVAAYGGDVITFAGDALMAAWPAVDEDLRTATRRAGHGAVAVLSALKDHHAAGGPRLSLRIGVGAGDVSALRVGGAGGRWHLLLSGGPLIQMSLAEQRSSPGEAVLSPEAWELARDTCTGKMLPGGYARLVAADAPPRPRDRSRRTEAIGEAVDAYVLEAVRARLAASRPEWLAELRRVSPLFLNLLDVDPAAPDQLAAVQSAMAVVQPIVQQYEGSLKEVVVDDKGLTLVAVFGLPPLAHEDDPARAARAALRAQVALRERGFRSAIGLATGRAFCGVMGSDVHREYAVIGATMNLAARLMQAAPDTILCDQTTRGAARSRLKFEALPAIAVKGRTEPVGVYRPVEPERHIESRRTIVGRAHERGILGESLRALEDGTSRQVLIEGEPGIGKSRLVADVLERARARDVRSLAGAGDGIEKTTPYHAWRPIFSRLFDLSGIDELEERRSRVLAAVQRVPELSRLAPLLNSVLPLDLPDNELTAQLTGEVRADNTRELLVRLLQADGSENPSRPRPLLVVLDDAHWLDSASWAVARHLVVRVSPLLLVIATRPLGEPLPSEYRRLRDDATAEFLQLEPLAARDTAALVCAGLGIRRLPENVVTLIDQRAHGNPFFSEELAYALRDADLIRIADGVCTIAPDAGALASVSFPDTARGLVAERIDRLSPGPKLTLKVASVLGRLFAFSVLRDVHPIDADRGALRAHLNELQRNDFTALDTPEPELAYLFKHVVTQEAAYDLLLYAQRRQLHRAVAEWYERNQADDPSALYPLLAHHWDRAAEPAKALAYLELAGEHALRAGASQEAVDFLTEAVRHGVELAPDALRQARWHRQLGDAYMGLGRLPESRLHAERAAALLGWQVPGTPVQLVRDLVREALRQAIHRLRPQRMMRPPATTRSAVLEAARAYERLGILNYYANARGAGMSAALHAVNLTERAGPSPELARAYATMGVAAGVVQLHALARRYGRHAREIARGADDLPALAYALLATSVYDVSIGNWARARERLIEALEIVEQLGDRRRWGELAALLAQVMYHQAEFDRLAEWSAEMRARAAHAEDAQRKAHALFAEVWLLLPQDRAEGAVSRLEAVTELLAAGGSRADEIFAYGTLALSYLRCQDRERARASAGRAASLIRQSQPVAAHIVEGYADVAEVYLSLWACGDDAAERPARQACAAFRRFARAIPIARPRAWLHEGAAAHLTGRQQRALAAWRRSLATAERLAMPYERGRAHYEIGRHLPPGDAARQAHLARSCEIFEEIGAPYERAHAEAAMS